MALELTIEGADVLATRLREAAGNIKPAAAQALYLEAEAVMARSKEEFVPVDLGVLRDSGHVGLPQITSDGIDVAMGFGGAASAYAVAVHEHLSEHSPASWKKAGTVTFSPSGHGPKYLERPLLEAAKGMVDRLARTIATAWK